MSSSRVICWCLSTVIFSLLVCGPAAAQHQHTAAASSAASACMSTGFGTVHHPVKTSNPEAQRAFEHGMALDYGFNHNQAEKCFHRAAELDPNMAMAYWGIALVLGTNYNLPVDAEREKQAYDAIQKALALSTNAPPNERAYIEALAKRYTDKSDPDYEQLEMEYHDSMRALYKRYPADLDAATLFAESGMNLHPWKLWSRDGVPTPGTEEIVAVLKSVLQRDPHHLGANHFYIHAVEASSHPEAALPSARRLAALAPESGHLVHMPAHIFIRTGDHESSEKTNVAAARADEAYFKIAHPQGIYPMMYYTHNLHFIAVENAFMGRYASAMDGANRVQANIAPHVKEMSALDFFNTIPIEIMVRFHRWDEIMSLPEPDASLPMSSGAWHFARAMACANGGKLDQAGTELEALRKLAPEMAKVSMDPQGLHNAETIPQIMTHFVEARIASAGHDTEAAIENLREAVSLEDSLDYNEPPDWLYPMREPLGAALLQAGKPAEAERVFREDLKRNARNPRSMFGLAESLKAQGKAAEAQTQERQFKIAWRNADTKLAVPEL
jgi:tetratricopeptide (TPR) repeat protein